MDKLNLRRISVDTLIELGTRDPRIVVLDGDAREPLMLGPFVERFPERSFSFGIAEQNMVSAAAGMATTGLIPFVHTYTQFLVMRALDQVRNTVAYPNLNVKFCTSHAGFDCGADGITHQTIEDFAILRSVPNMVVLSPADGIEMKQMIEFAVGFDGPVYFRLPKTGVTPVHQASYRFKLGQPSVVRAGRDITLFAHGLMVERALDAAKSLAEAGIDAMVVSVSSLKPLDARAVVACLDTTRAAVTIEDHNVHGGLGGAIAEILCRHAPLPLEMVGVADRFGEAGQVDQLFAKYGMDGAAIGAAARKAIARKKSGHGGN